MNLDALLHHYLGDQNVADPAAIARIALDFGVERDPGRRFALWTLMHTLGDAPDPDTAFKTPRERDAARGFARLMTRSQEADNPAG